MSYKKQELLTLRGLLGSHEAFAEVNVAHIFSFLICVVFVFVLLVFVLCLVLLVSLDCPFLIAPSVFSNVYF